MKKFNIPSIKELKDIYSKYKSTIDISQYKDKLYVDEEFGKVSEDRIIINYMVINGDYEVDTFEDDNGKSFIKFIDAKSGNNITIALLSTMEKIKLVNNIYPHKNIKQINSGMDVETSINKNSLYVKITAGVILTAIAGFLGKKYILNKNGKI